MAEPYGTVMIGRLTAPFSEVEDSIRRWVQERDVPGFDHEDIMLCDDGVTIVMSVFFTDEASYKALADDPVQAEWFENVALPMMEGDPQWLDGHWKMRLGN